jgi:hypothetical protein
MTVTRGQETPGQEPSARRPEPSARQTAQEELVQEAQKQPGVAEAMAAYRAFAPYTESRVAYASRTISYATGGNTPATRA